VIDVFVDASALVAVILREADFDALQTALVSAQGAMTTEFALMETGLAVMREMNRSAVEADRIVRGTLASLEIAVVPLSSAVTLAALLASERFGKGSRHPARLNMGDCLSYGAARVLDVPLLYKGDDFARTDVRAALTSR
jgi:ribonuclease VapC